MQANQLRQFETEPIGRLLLRYSIPAIVGNIVMATYNIIDRIFIGQGVGPEAIAGLGITFPVMNISTAFGVLVGVGGSSRVSILLGEKNYKMAQRVLGNALVLTIGIALAYIACFAVFIDDFLYMFGADEQTLPYAHDYLIYLLPGFLFINLSYSFNNYIRSSGYPRKAMITMFIGAVVNVILDPIFIFGFNMGIKDRYGRVDGVGDGPPLAGEAPPALHPRHLQAAVGHRSFDILNRCRAVSHQHHP